MSGKNSLTRVCPFASVITIEYDWLILVPPEGDECGSFESSLDKCDLVVIVPPTDYALGVLDCHLDFGVDFSQHDLSAELL